MTTLELFAALANEIADGKLTLDEAWAILCS